MEWKVAALYNFISIDNPSQYQRDIKEYCLAHNICGTLIIAKEGINGTIAGKAEDINVAMDYLDNLCNIRSGELKFSSAKKKPFPRLKVRLKKEIVTLRAPEADPTKLVGTYINPEEWNDVINDTETIVIDTRNRYETKIGMFSGAVDPLTDNFTEFKDYVSKNLDPEKNKKIAMYCTGGIRCEKASSYMLAHGFDTVYHLKGGILEYLEHIPEKDSLWEGSCFVFDRRVAIDHGLKESAHKLCFGCREPLEPEDLKTDEYEPGVSCPNCFSSLTPEKIRSLRMRHSQLQGHTE
jgi:UPF0176 protein